MGAWGGAAGAADAAAFRKKSDFDFSSLPALYAKSRAEEEVNPEAACLAFT
jgi:hypothetical protein